MQSGLPFLRLRARQKEFRVDRRIVQDNRPVQVRAGHTATGAHRTQGIAFFHRLTSTYIDAREVHVSGDQSLAVVDEHRIAIEEIVAGVGHHPGGRRGPRCVAA